MLSSAETTRIAIDSMPLAQGLSSTYDYSGFQVFGLTQAILGDQIYWALRNNNIHFPFSFENRETRIEIPMHNEVLWESGEKVSAKDYAHSVVALIKSNAFFSKLLFRNLKKVSADQGRLCLDFKQWNPKMFEILDLPQLCPLHSQWKYSGSYALTSSDGEEVNLSLTLKSSSSRLPQKIHFCHLKEPQQNFEAFIKQEVDVTADTAFDFLSEDWMSQSLQSCFQKKESGLIFHFRWANSCRHSLSVRRQLAAIIQSCDLRDIFGKFFQKTFSYLADDDLTKDFISWDARSQIQPLPLTLAYDPYYPNCEIVNKISKKLQAEGFAVCIVEDSFESPFQKYDLKLEIFSGLSKSDYIRYAGFAMHPLLIANPESWQMYMGILQALERSGDPACDKELLRELQLILNREAVSIPFARLPSCYFSQLPQGENPALWGLDRNFYRELSL